MSDNIIILSHILLMIFSLYLLIKRYIVTPHKVIMNYFSYLLFFSILYFSIPSIFTLIMGESLAGSSEDTIRYASIVGLYFVFIFFVAFKYVNITRSSMLNSKIGWGQTKTKKMILFISISIFIYTVLIDSIYFSSMLSMKGDRVAQSLLGGIFTDKYKFGFLFNIQVILISYLFIVTRKIKYLLLLIPFIVNGILLSDRDYIFKLFLLLMIFNGMNDKIIKIRYMIVVFIGLISVSFLRSDSIFEFDRWAQILLEFNLTWSTVHIIIDSPEKQDILSTLLYAFSKLFLTGSYELFVEPYHSYSSIITINKKLSTGLSGSLVAETLAFKNNLITFFIPIIITIYGYIINYLFRINMVFTKIIFIISILFIFNIIRMSFFEVALYPFYLMIYYGWIFLAIDSIRIKKIGYK